MHATRHSAPTLMLEKGAALAVVQENGLDTRCFPGQGVEPPIGIEPMTYSLRVNRSAD